MELYILEVIDAGHFLARECSSESTKRFQEVSREVNYDYNEYCSVSEGIRNPLPDTVYIGRCDDKKWYRVIVESTLQSRFGPTASCLLIDSAKHSTIPLKWLRNCPPKFAKFPKQAKEYKLYGIQPVTMLTSPIDFMTTMTPSDKFDPYATTMVKEFLKDKITTAEIIPQSVDDEYIYIRLYAEDETGRTECLNEYVVEKDLAVYQSPSPKSKTETLNTGHKPSDVTLPVLPSVDDNRIIHRRRNTPRSSRNTSRDVSEDESESRHQKGVKSHVSNTSKSTSPLSRVQENSDTPVKGTISLSASHLKFLQTITKNSSDKFGVDTLQERLTVPDTGNTIMSPQIPTAAPFQMKSPQTLSTSLQNISPQPRFNNRMSLLLQKIKTVNSSVNNNVETVSSATTVSSTTASIPSTTVPSTSIPSTTVPPKSVPSTIVPCATAPSNQSYIMPRMPLLEALNRRKQAATVQAKQPVSNTPSVSPQSDNLLSSNIAASNTSPKYNAVLNREIQDTERCNSKQIPSNTIGGIRVCIEAALNNAGAAAASLGERDNSTEQISPIKNLGVQNLQQSEGRETMARLPLHTIQDTNKPAVKSILRNENSSSSGLRVKVKSPEVSSDEENYVYPTQYHGDILLRKLSPDVYKRKYVASVQQHCLDFVGIHPTAREDEILVIGESIPKPFNALEKSPVGEGIKKAMFDRGFDAPRKIQAYTWPAILRGSHVVGISPSGSGKMLAYLVPLLTQLIQKSLYEQLPEGNWPKAIILTPSYKSCWNISDVINVLIGGHPYVKTLVIHAVDCEESQQIKLINGCDLLVATPHCLLRMLKNEFMDLTRLCHLIVDDAHILTEQFTEQIREIMTLYRLAVQDFESRPTPMQKIMFASQWTRGVHSFMESYMNDPIVYITSQFEMSVYGNVKPILHHCEDINLNSTILDILDDLGDETKVVALTKDKTQAEQIDKLLRAQSRYSLLCTHTMVTMEILEMIRRWKQANQSKSRPVLVMTDGCVPEIQLKDANCIVHCDLPTESKTKFGRRLSLMSDYFKPGAPLCTQHITVTEKCGRQVDTLVRYLKRVGEKPSKKLLKLSHDWIWKKEENKSEQILCHYLKAFGKCRDINSCKYRHVLGPSDGQVLPTSGEVKVLIINVKNASQYYVRLLEHRRGNEVLNHYGAEYVNVLLTIAEYYSDESNRHLHTVPTEGDMCVVKDSIGTFHRAKIIKLEEIEGVIESVHVFYIDDGTEKCVKPDSLYKLSSHLLQLPAQAVEVYVCRVKPVDDDIDWTPKVSTFVHALAFGKEIDGKVVLSLGRTLWLDPMVERSKLKTIKAISHNFNIRNELLQNNFAEDNLTHIKCLYELCAGRVQIPVTDRQQSSRSLGLTSRLETEILPQSVDRHNVYISAVTSPDCLFVQKAENFDRLDSMMEEINSDTDLPGTIDKSLISMDLFCLAKFSFDNKWYRAKVICERDGKYEVFFIDYGDREFVNYADMRHLPAKYAILSIQAIECKLVSVEPKGDVWDDEVGDYIWSWSHEVDEQDELVNTELSAECKMEDTCEPQFNGNHKYVIDVFDNNRKLSQDLVRKGFAVPSLDSAIEIFPESLLHVEVGESVNGIPTLCAKLVRDEVQLNRLQIAMDIRLKCDEDVETSHQADVIYYLSQLIQYVEDECSVLDVLLESLTTLVQNSESMLDEVYYQGGISAICRTFHKTKSDTVRQRMSKLFVILISLDENLNEIYRCEGIQSLCLQLSLAQNDVIRAIMLNCLNYFMEQDSENKFNGIIISELDKFNHILTMSKSKEVLSMCLTVIEKAIKTVESTEAFVTKHGIQTLCQLLDKTKRNKVIISVVNVLGSLHDRSKKNRTEMFNCQLPEILKRLSQSCFSDDSKNACQYLLEAIDPFATKTTAAFKPFKIKPQNDLNNSPLSKDEEDGQYKKELAAKSIHPEVFWSQNKKRVLLEVKVRGAKRVSMEVEGKAFRFSTAVDYVHYYLDMEMFDGLVKEKCHSVVRGTILVSLRKQDNKRWPYLLSNHLKPNYLHVDYDRYVDSSSESDAETTDDECNPFILSKTDHTTIPWKTYDNGGREMISEAIPEFLYNGRHPGSDSLTSSDDEINDPNNFLIKKDPYHDMLNEMLLNSPRY